jgi:hypothetical protein
MRIFRKQGNLIETSKATDKITGAILSTLVITFALYDETDTLVDDSDVTLVYNATTETYQKIVPTLSTLETATYQAELEVKLSGETLWYFKGPCKALIREQLDV